MALLIISLLIVFALYLICCAFGLVGDEEDKANRQYWKLLNTQEKFETRLSKLLRKVTDIEWTFYRKVFNKIKYTHADDWKVKKDSDKNHPLEPGDIYEIQIGNQLCLKTLKIEKDYRSHYECSAIELLKDGKCELSIIPPKEQMELYDLFVEYALYKLELAQKKLEEDEKKKVSEAHQNLIKEANQKFVI